MQAIIQTGGKQYRVVEGDQLEVEKLAGDSVSFTPLLLTKNGEVQASPGKVTASIVGEAKGDKVIVFKMKAKKRYRRKAGHRQGYSVIRIDKITA